jgi:O-antigen/teichoic acid export membrane protein
MCGAILFSISRFAVQCIYLARKYGISLKKSDFKFWKEQLFYSIPIGLGNVSWLLQTRLHKYFVSFAFNPKMFAVYSVGCFKLPLLNIITSSVGNVMIPAISRCQKEGNRTQILNIWNNAIRKMNLFLFPTSVFFFIMAHEFIVVLFTPDYTESIPIFRISLLAVFISGINSGAILQAYAETKYLMKLAFVRLPVTAAALYYFMNTWGVLGAVAADVLAIICFRLIVLGKVSKILDLPISKIIEWQINVRILLVGIISGLPLLLIKVFLKLPPLVLLISAGLVYGVTYLVLSIQFDNVHKCETEALKAYLNAKLGAAKSIHQHLAVWRR